MEFEKLDDFSNLIRCSTQLRGLKIDYFSKPGIPNWDMVSAAQILLAESASLSDNTRVLFYGCGPGAAAVAISRQFDYLEVGLVDTHCSALQCAYINLHEQLGDKITLYTSKELPPEINSRVDTVIIDLPKGRNLARRWLVQAKQALRDHGELYLAGANDEGVKPVIQDAHDLFGNSSILGYKKGNRIVRFLKKERSSNSNPNWASEAGIAVGTWHIIQAATPQGSLTLKTLPGVFSYEQLNDASNLLLNNLVLQPGERLLDLGCGYGILGLVCAIGGAAQVDLVDCNPLAVAATEENLKAYAVTQARAILADGAPELTPQHYTKVITNPPFHSGHLVDYGVAQSFIEQSYPILSPKGQFILVTNKFIRYEHLMKAVFGNCTLQAENQRYQVWSSQKPD